MQRRRDLGSWVLMAVLFIAAIALIFYILLMRAQSLARMEEQAENQPESRVVDVDTASRQPYVVGKSNTPGGESALFLLTFAADPEPAQGWSAA